MSSLTINQSFEELETLNLQSLDNEATQAPLEKESSVIMGRQWSLIGKDQNAPDYIHRLLALCSVAADAPMQVLEHCFSGQYSATVGVLRHTKQLFEGARDLIDYTGFINVARCAFEDGFDIFLAKEGHGDEQHINWFKTVGKTALTATAILFPIYFIESRFARANIAHGPSNIKDINVANQTIEAMRSHLKEGFPFTDLLRAISGLWLVGMSINFAVAAYDFGSKVHEAVSEEANKNPHATTKDLISAGWNKGATWENLNNLQIATGELAFAITNGGLIPCRVPIALACKAWAGINGVTQLFLPPEVKIVS